MRRHRTVFSDFAASGLWAIAIGGLLFPGHLFAQPTLSIPGVAAGGGDAHFQVELLELQEGTGLPTRLTVESGDRKLMVEYSSERSGYVWHEVDQQENSGFQALPPLDRVLQWEVDRDDDGLIRASIPVSHFATEERIDGVGLSPKPDLLRLEKPSAVVDVYGFLNPEKNAFELSAVTPDQKLIGMTISFASLDEETTVQISNDWRTGLTSKGLTIISMAALLAILGVVLVICAAMQEACWTACTQVCPFGVAWVSWFCGRSCSCQCFDPPGCGSLLAETDTIAIGDEAPPGLEPAPTTYTLSRFETSDVVHNGTPVSFLMAEWAVVTYTTGLKAGAEVLSASSEAFAAAQLGSLNDALVQKAGRGPGGSYTALVLATPDHGANSREIPLPELAFRAKNLSVGNGSILVRADFSDERTPSRFDVLYQDVGGLSAKELQELEDGFGLRYVSDDAHRTVVFAIVGVADGAAKVERVVTYLPKCCCGDQFCV